MDDFSAWLVQFGDQCSGFRDALKSIDFSFLTLSEMRDKIHGRLAAKGI